MADDKNDITNSEYCARLLIAWHFNEKAKENQHFVTEEETDVISKIIHYRTKRFNVKIPLECAYIISICAHGNPGMAIIIYYTLLKSIVERDGKLSRNGYIIKSIDFSLTFPTSFPDMEIADQRNKFEKLWDEQKDTKGKNKVDTYEYWNELFV